MFTLLAQIWTSFTAFFIGIEKFMNAFVSLASVAEDTADTFRKEESILNKRKLDDLEKKAKDLDIDFSKLGE